MTFKLLSDGSCEYLTAAGDMLDAICWRHYGREWNATELVLDTNYGLSRKGPVYDAGVKIILPRIAPTEEKKSSIRLWD